MALPGRFGISRAAARVTPGGLRGLARLCGSSRAALLRDVVEMLVWNDDGLVQASVPFLDSVSEPGRRRALSELARLVAELDEGGLVDKARKARNIMCGVALSGG